MTEGGGLNSVDNGTAAATANATAVVTWRRRCPSVVSPQEDLLACKAAFVAAGEDARVGTNQKGTNFKKRALEICTSLATMVTVPLISHQGPTRRCATASRKCPRQCKSSWE